MIITSEETPLLSPPPEAGSSQANSKHEDIYFRFGRRRKWAILAMVSWGGLLPLFVGGSFIPSIPQIAKDLHSNGAVISLAVSVSILASSLGSMAGATYAGFYGRRPVYLFGLPILFLGSIGVALSKSVTELMIWRFFQAMGSAPGLSIGAGVVGDIYKLEERGRAMSVFFCACLLGPALAPVTGGFSAHYASWRTMQLLLGCVGLVLFALIYLYLPETSHPGTMGVEWISISEEKLLPTWRPVLLNPLQPLALLRSPALLFIALITTFSLFTYQVLLIPLAYTLGVRYGITNEALIGACFIPAGLGNLVGAPIIGQIADSTIIKWRKKRNGIWYPEDRLRPALPPLITLVPVSIVLSGFLSKYGGGRLGLALNLFCLFLNGLGIEMVWGPCAAYLVDVMHSRSAECIAGNSGLRSALVSIGVAFILPMINTFGVLATNIFAAFVSLFGVVLLWTTIRYGKQLRDYADVGFSTVDNN